ncbi:hypothetical protein, partial [Nocardia cyriacigeorgica]|uniref:hypothetical protein n=1 Tax=Nocardia cyriacigeorgica TaxID=135487 RepID=UPI003CC7E901
MAVLGRPLGVPIRARSVVTPDSGVIAGVAAVGLIIAAPSVTPGRQVIAASEVRIAQLVIAPPTVRADRHVIAPITITARRHVVAPPTITAAQHVVTEPTVHATQLSIAPPAMTARRKVDAVQRADPQRRAGRELPVRDHRAERRGGP